MPRILTIELLQQEAVLFSKAESTYETKELYGVTDGKAVGTYLEHKFQTLLQSKYEFIRGSSAKGIDLPELNIDIKVTSIRQPQSSCPFRSARQKIYGLGYSLIIFVYDKTDNARKKTGKLDIRHTVFVAQEQTADYQTTNGILELLKNNANKDDILAFFHDRLLPVDDIEASNLADEILRNPPELGYLTISNALQWRLQYSRVIEKAGSVDGIVKLT
jgi:hypothetical protein